MQDVLTLILGGGRGERLYPLTRGRSEPAVPLAGKYRLIDIPISNCLNSGLNQIYVLTQFLSVSLHRHIAATYKVGPFASGFVEVLAAQQTNESALWYQGTADAVRQNLRYIQVSSAEDVLILYADQVYRMDLEALIRTHRQSRADVTLAVVPVDAARAGRLGLMQLDAEGRIIALSEKPHPAEVLASFAVNPAQVPRRGNTPAGRAYLANMGIYLFRRAALFEMLAAAPGATDLVHGVFASNLAGRRFQAHLFDGYWEDLGTIKSYFEAHLALVQEQPPFDFNSPQGVIFTRMRNLPASRVQDATVAGCLIADGCTVQPGARLERCVVGVRSQVGAGVRLRDTIVIGADEYESPEQRDENRAQGVPDLGIGAGSVIERAIIDKDCRIGRNVKIINKRGVQNEDANNYVIRDGIVVIPNEAVIPDGTVI
jgi:glucose-1-phosphate adenylyltransferase